MVLVLMMSMSMLTVAITSASAETTATVNGQRFNVGDEAKFQILLQVPEMIENLQGYVEYDKSGLEFVSVKHPNHSNGSWATNGITEPGMVYYSATDGMDGYDFLTKKTAIEITFKVTSAGTYNIANTVEVMTGLDITKPAGTPYYRDSVMMNPCKVETSVINEIPNSFFTSAALAQGS